MSILQQKRKLSNIDPKKLTLTVFDGEERFNNFKAFTKILTETVKTTPEIFEKSRDELFTYVIEQSNTIHSAVGEFLEQNELPPEANVSLNFSTIGAIGWFIGGYLIKVMATEEQKNAWFPSVEKGVWYMTYAQTELGHGTDVQGLETVASFDTDTQEFVIHTPNIAAIKFWPGDLSVGATHALVMARLVSNGKFHGVKPFFFAIRDTNTMEPLPGVEIGDVGPKMGMMSKDNGFMK